MFTTILSNVYTFLQLAFILVGASFLFVMTLKMYKRYFTNDVIPYVQYMNIVVALLLSPLAMASVTQVVYLVTACMTANTLINVIAVTYNRFDKAIRKYRNLEETK